MSEMADIIFCVFLYLFQGYCLQYFCGSFLESRIRDRRWNALAVMVSYAVSRRVLFQFQIGSEKNWDHRVGVGKMALALCVMSVLVLCFYRALHLITIFLVVAFQAIADISRYTTVILVGELGDGLLSLWNWCAGRGLLTSEKAFSSAVNTGILGQWILEYLAMALILYLSLKKIVGDFREKDHNMDRTELLFILTPAAVGLTLCMLLRIVIITMEGGIPKLLYDRYPILIFVLPAIMLLSLLSILQGVRLFQDMLRWNREKSSRIVLEKQVAGMQEHMEEMERINAGIRSMKHDMKNTILVIQRLAVRGGEGENEELRAYLSELERTFEKLDVRFRTGNTVVDTLLNMKYHEAVREVPDLDMDADGLMFPQELKIRSYDIGVILGNALDNAIEACRRLKEKERDADAFIRLGSLQKRDLLILKVENSFDGRLAGERPDGFLASDKTDKDSHGIGLANIKSTAEGYQGTMDYRVEDRVFILSVMMKNERRDDDGSRSDK